MKKKWSKTAAIIGVTSETIESTSDGVYFSNEQVDSIEAHAEGVAIERSEAATQIAAAETARQTAEAELATANTSLQTATQRITALEAENGAHIATIANKDTEITTMKGKLTRLPVQTTAVVKTGSEAVVEGEEKYSWTKAQAAKKAQIRAKKEGAAE